MNLNWSTLLEITQTSWGNLQCECFFLFLFFQPVHDKALDWGTNRKGDFPVSRIQTERSWTLATWDAPLQRNPIFTLKGRLICQPLFLFHSFSPLLSSCSMSLEEGRLHKSVTQEIPTLYFLSDKEPVMGDEFVAAGGFDRLGGNNKAISACQRSRRTEREKHTRGRYKSLVWWLQFFLFGGEMRQLNCTERWVAWPQHSCGVEITQWPNKDVL